MLSTLRRIILLTVMIAAVAGFPAAHAQNTVAVDITFTRTDGTTTSGTVHAPAGATGRPGVVLVHGSGNGSGEHYDLIAEAFARAGVVALRYDKRTEGYTPAHRDYALLADDALAGLAALRNRPEVDPARVGLWGLSEGGWVAPLAASRSTEAAFLITVAANSAQPAAQQAWANETRFGAAGVRGSMVDVLARNGIRQLVAADQFAQADYDPIPVLKKITQPVLAIWGDQDRLTPPGDSLRGFQAAFDHIGKTNYTLRTLPNAQHAGQPTTDGFDKLPGLAPGYGELMGDWVNGLPGSATPPAADQPAAQGHPVRALTPASWWESTAVQLTLLFGTILALSGYAFTGLVGRWRLPDPRPARVLVCATAIGIVGTVVQLGYILTTRATSFGPLLFGRTLPWLALQLVALGAVVALGVVLVRARHTLGEASAGARIRWALLVCGGTGFVLWALYWGLLLP
ncbi:prolyl oligopeptidase family serine peptidase [Nocardia sp. PE-7]|uniref:alpha/beta hydrolase family protein n=1 Tax=Nocardia sp. PE-7 TaxID=3058426 RepID=UPI00265A27EF|nr:prolyl oligopeptidase family serine peptidase [Nocardia sp. PE-7]WKG09921.1 prolyl oligopeptidase family serine peptidase [Nocardia sp. PE-7]